MRSRGISTALAFANAASAALVHISAYTGNVTTLELTASSSEYTSQAALQSLDVSDGCGAYPSWLTLLDGVLYCVNENWPDPNNGTLASFRVSPEGQLTLLSNISTPAGPVSAVVYGDGGRGLAIANYAGASISTYNITDPSSITLIKHDPPFPSLTAPANPQRQDKSHPHQTLLDPTGEYLFVPDLGTDLIRIFALNKATLGYTSIPPLPAARGAGPRHGAFVKGTSKTFFYVVHELSNTLVGYEVIYNTNKTLSFKQVHSSNTHGENTLLPNTTAAAEVLISPDSRFLTLSSRFDGTLTVPNYDPGNATAIPSDPLITFTINRDTGALSHLQTRACGGSNPRHFSYSKDGTMVGVALQGDGRTVIINRDPESGLLGEILSHVEVPGLPNCIIFNE